MSFRAIVAALLSLSLLSLTVLSHAAEPAKKKARRAKKTATAGSGLAAEPPKDPILRIEVGSHTAVINKVASDATGRFLVTASDDKTLRVWDLPPAAGKSKSLRATRTIRLPIGAGIEGKLYAMDLSPDGATIACGGRTGWDWEGSASIYLFDRVSGSLNGRITGLPNIILHLAFSPDGRFLAASLGGKKGVRLYRTTDWSLVGEDTDYGEVSYSVHFSQEGRLVTTSYDGFVRLYEAASGSLHLIAKAKAPGGSRPAAARFSPDGSRVAIGYSDTANVSVLSGNNLVALFSPDTVGVVDGGLSSVAWSADGQTLFAGGTGDKLFNNYRSIVIRRWSDAGRGAYSDTAASSSTVRDITSLPDGRLAYGTAYPDIRILDPAGEHTLYASPIMADYRANWKGFRLSPDGAQVGFGFEARGKAPASFDLATRRLTTGANAALLPPMISANGLSVTDWKSTAIPKLNGTTLQLKQYEFSRALALAPDAGSFVLGSDWFLYHFNRSGRQLWEVPVPATVWAVNVARNGALLVAAYADGTIRWHRLSDGKELLAFFPHADRKRWVLWTPEGFFDHSPGGEELIGFHLNRGKDREAEFIPVSKLYNQFYRPDLVAASFEGKDISMYAKAMDINKLLSATTLPPKVRMITTSGKTDGPETTVTAELCDSGGGIGDVTLYLNTMPIAVESGGRGLKLVEKKRDDQCYSFSRNLTLGHGDNVVSIMAYNKGNTIESERDSITINHASAFTGKPDLYILTIAVDKYRDGDLQLKYSNADAKAVAELISGKGKELFGRVNHYTLSDAEVTREKLAANFAEIGKKTRREDMFILFVAGHGITYSKDGSFYFLPVDFRYSQDEDIPKKGVSMDDFKKYLANIQATKSLLLLDTCNSGSFAEAVASRGVIEKTAINKLTRAVGRHTIVASSKSQVALEGLEGHGAFSWVLLDGMQGKAANPKGQITVNSLVSFVESTLPDLTYKKWGYEQIPQKSLVGEDFAIGVK